MSAGPEVRWVTFTVAESDDMFAVPETGVKMPVTVTFESGPAGAALGPWVATYSVDDGPSWAARGDTQDEAIVRLLAARIGVVLP